MSMLLAGPVMNGGVESTGIPQDFESHHPLSVDATDETGTYNGTLIGNASVTGGYLVLDGSGDACSNGAYPATSQVTVSVIVNLSTLNDRGVIFGDSDGLSNKTRVLLYVTGTNNWGMQIGDGTSFWVNESIPHGLSTDVDYEIQYEINSTAVKIRVDGSTDVSVTSTIALSSQTTTPWTFGRLGSYNGAADFYFTGKMKDIYRYHRVLNSTEQSALTARL